MPSTRLRALGMDVSIAGVQAMMLYVYTVPWEGALQASDRLAFKGLRGGFTGGRKSACPLLFELLRQPEILK